MRRFPSSWTKTLDKLGFRRTGEHSKRRRGTYGRRSLVESLEPRHLLSITVDSPLDNTIAGDGFKTLREAFIEAAQSGDSIDF